MGKLAGRYDRRLADIVVSGGLIIIACYWPNTKPIPHRFFKAKNKTAWKNNIKERGIKKTVDDYNSIASTPINEDDVERGMFPWVGVEEQSSSKLCRATCDILYFIILIYSSSETPVHMKSLVVEKEMEILRFQEEILLLQKEFHNFLVYYKDIRSSWRQGR